MISSAGAGPISETDADAAPLAFLAVVMDCGFVVAVTAFLLMHAQLLWQNATTIEMYEARRQLVGGGGAQPGAPPQVVAPVGAGGGGCGPGGRRRLHFEEVFGASPRLWLLPLHSRSHLKVPG